MPRAALARFACALAFLLAVAVAPGAWAAAGRFTFVTGEVTLQKRAGAPVPAAAGMRVDAGDRILTGGNGMAQLTMVDQARLSLRPNSNFLIERYPEARESTEGVVLNLLRGTLRAFTGLIASSARERFTMKTRVATVGIRGSGNILYACDGKDCDPSVAAGGTGDAPVMVNHTIEGSHVVTSTFGAAAGEALITGPGQTVLVQRAEPPRFIPTPAFIADAATNMVNAKPAAGTGTAASEGDVRSFSPGDSQVLPASQTAPAPLVGNNGLGFPTIDASQNLSRDPLALHDAIIVFSGSPVAGQALGRDMRFDGNELRGYTSYPDAGVQPAIVGGASRDFAALAVGGGTILLGRWENASLGFFGEGSTTPIPGSMHWIVGPSGYPTYLADVLTGVATYQLAAATAPTTQGGVTGTLGSASLDVNFSDRTLGIALAVSMPGVAAGGWQVSASGVPFALNRFFASTGDRLVVTNGAGQSSASNGGLGGSVEGSFVGTGLEGAILGYGITDRTSGNPAEWSEVSGVAAFTGPAQQGDAPFREGRVSDPAGTLADFIRSFATTDRPDEVASDSEGRVTGFTAPYLRFGSHATYSIGTSQVVESGADPVTGLVWGRWSGGVAQVHGASGQNAQVFLGAASLHYLFAAAQAGPVALPLTGSAAYDVVGSTSPTDGAGHVGQLNSASLDANFTNRTVDAAVSIGINGQTWTGSANAIPIYRDQYFSAYSGTPIPGVPNPSPLSIGCSPSCGVNAAGSFDGFFTGATGEGAGMMYNLGGNQGAVAFGRRGGG